MGEYTQYHKEQAMKNAIALQDHLNRFQCPDCINKHALALEQYLEEEMETNPEAEDKLRILADKVRRLRKEIAITI